MCTCVGKKVKGQFAGAESLLYHMVPGMEYNHQAWQQVPLHTEPASHWSILQICGLSVC